MNPQRAQRVFVCAGLWTLPGTLSGTKPRPRSRGVRQTSRCQGGRGGERQAARAPPGATRERGRPPSAGPRPSRPARPPPSRPGRNSSNSLTRPNCDEPPWRRRGGGGGRGGAGAVHHGRRAPGAERGGGLRGAPEPLRVLPPAGVAVHLPRCAPPPRAPPRVPPAPRSLPQPPTPLRRAPLCPIARRLSLRGGSVHRRPPLRAPDGLVSGALPRTSLHRAGARSAARGGR